MVKETGGGLTPPAHLEKQKAIRIVNEMAKNSKTAAPAAAPIDTNVAYADVLGLDIGYGVVKGVQPGNAPGQYRITKFPSLSGFARRVKFRPEQLAERYPGDQFSDEHGDWFIGDLAQSQLKAEELRVLRGRGGRDDVLGNETRLRFALVAIGKLYAGRVNTGDVVHVRLVTGLPVDHMTGAARLKEALMGRFPIKSDQGSFIANIVDVSVMPQPYGAIYAHSLCADGALNAAFTYKRVGVLDVGTYTIDATTDADGEFISAESGSVEGGMHVAQSVIADLLESTYGQKFKYGDVEAVLRTKNFRAYGQDVSYAQPVTEALKSVQMGATSLATTTWKTGVGLDVLYLVGGGAPAVEQDILDAGFVQAVVVGKNSGEGQINPQIANAVGYLHYGKFLQREGQ